MQVPSHLRYYVTTRSKGDGSEPEYVVYWNREIVARFPINDPSSPAAHDYANIFASAMNNIFEAVYRSLK